MKQKLFNLPPTNIVNPRRACRTVQTINNGSIAKKVLDDIPLTERQPCQLKSNGHGYAEGNIAEGLLIVLIFAPLEVELSHDP
jgi:hypothetical protein